MFQVKEHKVAYKRFLQLNQLKVLFPNNKLIDWDVVGNTTAGPHFCTVFPYNSKDKTVRIIREYAQGPNEMVYSLVAGGFDVNKHEKYLFLI